MGNIHSIPSENEASFLKRFFIYQKERFPILGHGLLVASFSFSAIAYSRICRGAEGFVPWSRYLTGIITTITLFLLVRIFDEFKDREDDAKYRPELPVPRGLVSLRELLIVGIAVTIIQVAINAAFFPVMLRIWAIVILYLSLMGKEFFIPRWLKRHQFWYVSSHMFIIPLIDIYASGLDWLVEKQAAPKGLLFFFAVSYFNGIVLEIGRKIRTKENESEGVLTYTSMLGIRKAIYLWIGILFVTLGWAVAAAWFAGYGESGLLILGIIFIICMLPAFFFLAEPTAKRSKMIEYASGLWTIAMYFTLGAIPMITRLITGS